MPPIQLLDIATTLKPIPAQKLTLVEPEHQSIASLPTGQVGTIVEIYPTEQSSTDQPKYLIEFADTQGREYAMVILRADEILVLHYELAVAAG